MSLYTYEDTLFIASSYSEAATSIFLPGRTIDITGVIDGPQPATNPFGYYWNFTARSIGGSNYGVYLFGMPFSYNFNMRFAASASAGMEALLAELSNLTIPLCGIDKQQLVWNSYVNIGINDYAMHQARQ